MAVTVIINRAQLNDILADLRSYEPPEMEKRLRRATLAGANVLKRQVASDAPQGKTGKLRGSPRARATRTYGRWIGYRVTVGGRGVRYANVVVGGSRPHLILGKVGKPLGLPWGPRMVVHHPGARANPFVARAGDEEGDAVLLAMAKSIASQRTRAGF
jgi:hypothetical protein